MRVKMVVFDMDGVLVDVRSSWQFVHDAFKVSNEENVRRYLNCQITYRELLKRDIILWGRVHVDEIQRILAKVPLMDGAEETIRTLKEAGFKTAIISAGISFLADQLQEKLGIDYSFANKVLTDGDGMLTGEGEEVVNLLEKTKVLRKLALKERTEPSNFVVVGDSVYDIPLFKEAELSIAFNADDDQVRNAASYVVNGKNLTEILYYIIKWCKLSGRDSF